MTVLIISIIAAWIIFSALLVVILCVRSTQLGERNRSELGNEQARILKSAYKRNKHDS